MCDFTIHYTCLNTAGYLPEKWSNKNTPSTAVRQIFSSSYFKFLCKTCSDSQANDELNLTSANNNINTDNFNKDINNMAAIETIVTILLRLRI